MRPGIAALAAQLSPRVIPAHAFRPAHFHDGRVSAECYELLPDSTTHGGRSFCLLPDGEHVFDGMYYGEHGELVEEVDRLTSEVVELRAWVADAGREAMRPIPMVLHCPACRGQHIDAPEPEKGWTNPPHRSHLCAFCGTVWRPCDALTTGVESLKTRGKADTWRSSEGV